MIDQQQILDVQPITIEGSYVRLEPLTQAHAEGLAAISADEAIWRYYPSSLLTLTDVQAWIDIALAQRAAGTSLPFAILDKAGGRAIGSTRYMNIMPRDR